MNSKANSMEMATAVVLEGSFRDVDEAVASAALARAGRFERAVPCAEPSLWLALGSVDHRAGELWETLSYLVIWVCGLAGVGLCFL